jgi:molecular chaperone GrpE
LGEDRPHDDDEEPGAPRESVDVSGAVVADEDPQPESEAAQAYHQRARLAEDRLAEVLGAYRKLKTDNEGHRERITRNLDRRYEQRRERLLLKFIDILDNLDRALEAAAISYAGEPLLEGMILVRTQLLQTLQDEGLERIPVVGLPFDPHLSESVGTQPVDEPEQDHIVVKEHMRGYRLNGRIARASTVVIGAYAPPGTGAETELPKDEAAIEVAPAPPAIEIDVPLEAADLLTETDVPAVDEPVLEIILPEDPEPPPPLAEAPSGEPSLEDIIAQAEAQEALFPHAFNAPGPKKKSED